MSSKSSYRYFSIFLRNVKAFPPVGLFGGRMERPSDSAPALEVWIDGDCRLCQRSRAWCELRAGDDHIRFRDFRSAADPDLPVTRGDLEKSMWVRDESGHLVEGFGAWRAIMNELPGWRWLAWLVAVPPMRWLGPPIYRMIARNRHRLSAD